MKRLRIVSWNIHSCVGTDREYDPQRIARVLSSFDADIIGLQEVDWRRPDVDGRDQLDYLAAALDMTAIEGPNLEDHLGRYGNGLLTRLEVDAVTRLEIAEPGFEPRGLIDARLVAGGHRLRALVTHLGLSRSERRRQLGTIAAELEAIPPEANERIVLMGDLNEWLPGKLRNSHGFQRWFHDEAAPRTFPAQRPLLRLDRVLAGSSLVPRQLALSKQDLMASDHRPVCVELELETGT